MESEGRYRTKLFIGTIILNTVLACFILFSPIADARSLSYWLGLLTGLVLGILMCVYMRAVWDPYWLDLKDPNAKAADPRWMPISVVGGIVFARLVLDRLNPEIATFLMNAGFVWVIITLSYTGFMAWWHRPRF